MIIFYCCYIRRSPHCSALEFARVSSISLRRIWILNRIDFNKQFKNIILFRKPRPRWGIDVLITLHNHNLRKFASSWLKDFVGKYLKYARKLIWKMFCRFHSSMSIANRTENPFVCERIDKITFQTLEIFSTARPHTLEGECKVEHLRMLELSMEDGVCTCRARSLGKL